MINTPTPSPALSENIRIASPTIGFADGYPRGLSKEVGKVCLNGRVFPVFGHVCMDRLMVNLGPIDNPSCPIVNVGDLGFLWGPTLKDQDNQG